MELIVHKLQWLFDHPEVTWSGAGITLLGILYFIAKRIIFSMRNICKLDSGIREESKHSIANETPHDHSVHQQHSGVGDNIGRDKIIKNN